MNCKTKSFMTKKKAFTLIELLIVIAIIGILFIVLVSKVDFATDKAKATGVQTDFRSFQMAFDTVAKENAGFNTFGWDTGDANQDGIRNSYDEGDNGAGGGTANNGIQDGTEVFTGHKVYTETFTKVFSLKKNGTGSYDRDALNRLETAINANLDPKLHVTIKDDGEIVMANGAKDPWNKEYHGWYITNAETDKQDRGAIVMYSDGANNEFGSEHKIANGVVSISIPGSNKNGKDDYAVVSCYTYLNGYGEVKNMTSGFSNNQNFVTNGTNNNTNIGDGDNLGNDEPLTPAPIELAEGLYDENDQMICTFEELQTVYGWNIETYSDTYMNTTPSTNSLANILKNNETLSKGTKLIVDYLENTKEGLFHSLDVKTIIVRDSKNIGQGLFYNSKAEYIELGGTYDTLPERTFQYCRQLIEAKIPDTIRIFKDRAFSTTDSLQKVNISPETTHIGWAAFDSKGLVASKNLPDTWMNLEEVQGYAFAYNMYDGRTVTFGPNLKALKYECIFYCSKSSACVTLVFLGATPPSVSSSSLHTSGTFIIKVPAESVDAYKNTNEFSKFADNIFPIE